MFKDKFMWKCIFGGALISMGCIAFLLSDIKIIGSILFSIGLLTIIFFQQKLYTGALCTKIKSKHDVLDLFFIYAGNMIGTIWMAWLISGTKLYPTLKPTVEKIVESKANDSFISLFILGIMCEVCIYIAVRSMRYAPQFGPLFIMFGVTIFVFCGFEHCIADWFYVMLAHTSLANILHILVPVTLGNTLCGVLLSLMQEN